MLVAESPYPVGREGDGMTEKAVAGGAELPERGEARLPPVVEVAAGGGGLVGGGCLLFTVVLPSPSFTEWLSWVLVLVMLYGSKARKISREGNNEGFMRGLETV
jgi:hypothetical protein